MKTRTVRLEEIARVVQGGRHGLSGDHFVERGYPAYGAGGLNGYLESYEFEGPAVILSSIGARCGKCFYADGRWSSLANTQVILPASSAADARFLWFRLNDEGRWPRSGTGQPFIKPSDVKGHLLELPSLPEQRRIAATLEQADRLRRTRRYALELSDTFLPAAFLEMFGDPVRNPKRWPVTSIEDVVVSSQYGTSRKSNLVKRGFPVLGMANITDRGDIDLSNLAYVELPQAEFDALQLRSGDILFNRTNSTELVGKTACWRHDLPAVVASYLVRLQLGDAVIPEFFAALLNTERFKRLFQKRCKKAVGQSNISPTLLKEFHPYPPAPPSAALRRPGTRA